MSHIPTPGDLAMDLIRSKEHGDKNTSDFWYKNALKIFPIACQDLAEDEKKRVKNFLAEIGNLKLSAETRLKNVNECVDFLFGLHMEFLTGKRPSENPFYEAHRNI